MTDYAYAPEVEVIAKELIGGDLLDGEQHKAFPAEARR